MRNRNPCFHFLDISVTRNKYELHRSRHREAETSQRRLLLRILRSTNNNRETPRKSKFRKMGPQEKGDRLTFYVNGQLHSIAEPKPEDTLLQYLRSTGLTGTKLGCAEGGCGACTVLVSTYNPSTRSISHCSVNACLAPLCSMHERHVITIEGLGTARNPHPVQERIAAYFGSQCGFCTPGIAMSLYALLRNDPTPSLHAIEETFDGNLCRCTGYRPILDAARTFSSEACAMGDKCCKNSGNSQQVVSAPIAQEFKRYDPSQELIFPPALINRLSKIDDAQNMVVFRSSRCTWYRPSTLEQLLELKANDQAPVKIVTGNTEVGIETKFKNQRYPVLVYPMEIPELCCVVETDAGVEFGACLTLNKFRDSLLAQVRTCPEYQTRGFRALLENLRWFAGNQVRNVATIAGNIVTASPISDLNPIFVATGSILTVQEHGKSPRKIPMAEFFLGYRKTALLLREVVLSVFVPYTLQEEYVHAFKQAKRRDDDIAIVTSGMRVNLGSGIVKSCCFAFGGMGPTTVTARAAAEFCVKKKWTRDLVDTVSNLITMKDMPLAANAPGGMVEYRRSLAISFFFKFFVFVSSKIDGSLAVEYDGAIDPKHRPLSHGHQVYYESSGTSQVGKNVVHMSALKQVTGEAVYTDDTSKIHHELYAGLVMSSKAHANIISIDTSAALAEEGVHAFVSHGDVPGENMIGPVFKDEELFATKKVLFVGQLIGLIIADSQQQAQRAAKLVRIEYEELPHILTIEEAIERKAFFDITKTMAKGDIDSGFKDADGVIEGEFKVGAQNHFYLETQASIVIPGREDDEIVVLASTQNPTETQHLVARVLGLGSHKVVCRVKRMGGGFGGKETRSATLSCSLAVAARKLGRPIRCMLDRDEDMVITGQRHSFLGKYRVGY
eukprot:Partr_v1_DN28619_c0_g1_i3_m49964 putative aldehyde oxidase